MGRSWGGLGGILDGLWLSWKIRHPTDPYFPEHFWGYLGPILGGLGPFCGGHDRLGWPWCHLENQASQRTIVLLSLSLSLSLSLLAFSFGTPRIHEAHNVQSHELVCMPPTRNRVVITTRLVEKVAARSPFPTPSGSLLHCVQVASFCLLLRSFVCFPC